MKKILKVARRAAVPSGYTKKEIRDLIEAAARAFPEATEIAHILPRAYCLAKPWSQTGVFAVPKRDREPQVEAEASCLVQSESCGDCKVGEW